MICRCRTRSMPATISLRSCHGRIVFVTSAACLCRRCIAFKITVCVVGRVSSPYELDCDLRCGFPKQTHWSISKCMSTHCQHSFSALVLLAMAHDKEQSHALKVSSRGALLP